MPTQILAAAQPYVEAWIGIVRLVLTCWLPATLISQAEVDGDRLLLRAPGRSEPAFVVSLPVRVKPGPVAITSHNGVTEITLDRAA